MAERERRIDGLGALWALIREDLRVNMGVTRPGFQALAVHRFGVWKHGLRSRILRAPLSALYTVLNLFVRNVYGIELERQTRIGRRVLFAHQHGITVHRNAVIGDDCIIRQGVSIGQDRHTPHGPPPPAPRLGDRVQVGAGAMILGNVAIGDDVMIAPNVVVMTSVPAGSIVAAQPARIMSRPPRKKAPETATAPKAARVPGPAVPRPAVAEPDVPESARVSDPALAPEPAPETVPPARKARP